MPRPGLDRLDPVLGACKNPKNNFKIKDGLDPNPTMYISLESSHAALHTSYDISDLPDGQITCLRSVT